MGQAGYISVLLVLGISVISCQVFEKQERSTDENGRVIVSHTLKGEKHGKHTVYFQDGKVRMVDRYKRGVLVRHKRYYHSGQIREDWNYSYPEGKITGTLKKWYKNGQLKEKTEYENGEKSGSSYFYDTAGHILKSGHYLSDNQEGWWDAYSPNNGALIRHSYYRRGIEDTLSYSYYETGEPRSYLGRIPSTRLCHYWEKSPSGYLMQTGYYIYKSYYTYPQQDSIWTNYDQNGNIKQFTHFQEGRRNGLERIYHPNGQLNTERTYRSDRAYERYEGHYRTWCQIHSPGTKSG